MANIARIGKFTIDRDKRLGQGNYGSVYLGTDGEGQSVAGKEIYLGDDDPEYHDPDWIARVNAEVNAHKRIPGHVNLVKFVDTVTKGNNVWVFTDPCEIGDLNKYMKNNDVSERQKFQIMKELAQVLHHLHSLDPPISHRDVKSENLLMGDDGHIKLCDLGLTKFMEMTGDRAKTLKTNCGTNEYKAPELFILDRDGRPSYTIKVDVFSAGIFYISLINASSRKALEPFMFQGKSVGQQMYENHKYGGWSAPPIKFQLQDSPQVKQLKALVNTMIQFDPDDRPTMGEVLDELNRIIALMPNNHPQASLGASGGASGLTEAMSRMNTSDVRPKNGKQAAQRQQEQHSSPETVSTGADSRTRNSRSSKTSNTSSNKLTIIGGCIDKNYDISTACWQDTESGWQQVTSLPENIVLMAVSAVNGRLFIAGGAYSNNVTTNHCYVYTAATRTWRRCADMPTARMFAAAVTVPGEKVVVLGGSYDGKLLGVCEQYDVRWDEWTGMSDMPQGMAPPIAALVQSYVYLVFNDSPANKSTQQKGCKISLQVLDMITGAWSLGPPLPAEIGSPPPGQEFGRTWGASAVAINDTLLVCGGYSRLLAQYVPSTRVWHKLIPPSLQHIWGSSVVSEGRVILMGGMCKDESGEVSFTDVIEEYDVQSDRWVTWSQKMTCALWFHHAVMLK